jgi:hypothetical protein
MSTVAEGALSKPARNTVLLAVLGVVLWGHRHEPTLCDQSEHRTIRRRAGVRGRPSVTALAL